MGSPRSAVAIAIAAMGVLAGLAAPAIAGPAAGRAEAQMPEQPPPGVPRITVTAIDPPADHTVSLHEQSEISDRGQVLLHVVAGVERFHGVWRRGVTEVLGPVPESTGNELDMSDRGHVVGLVPVPGCEGAPASPNCLQPTLWTDGEATPLPTDGPVYWGVLRVSDRGHVVGALLTYDPSEPDGFYDELVLWRGSETVRAPAAGLYSPAAINGRGHVALHRQGSLQDGFLSCGVVWRVGGAVTELDPCGTIMTRLRDINEMGQALGSFWTLAGPLDAFLWEDGQSTNLGLIEPVDLNDRGEVAGRLYLQDRGVLWRDGTTIDLGTLGGNWSRPVAVNDHSQVVGNSQTADGEQHAFLWQDGQLVDLGAVAGATVESTAIDVNNRGQIIGTVDGRPVVWTVLGRR